MKILYIELENFIGVKAAMKTDYVRFEFGDINKPIIQIYGPNHCGKTVLAHLLHPFATINFTGDERNDLSLIISGKTGVKKIGYDVNGILYNITHTYSPTRSSHSISSSILKNGEELNPSGGVNTFNTIIQHELGINKYTFQFIINGTQLTNMGTMTDTQRKNAMYKAMGIDIYNSIHKMATDDYRYTNKLITALNNSREFLLQNYGTYENMCTRLEMKKNQFESLNKTAEEKKTRIAELEGKISTLKDQNISEELAMLNNQLATYENVISKLGDISNISETDLVNQQINFTNELTNVRIAKSDYMKDRDILLSKREDIQNTMRQNQKAMSDYDELKRMKESLENQINSMTTYNVTSQPAFLSNMINLAHVVNSTAKEIITSLNDKLLNLLCDMLIEGIDVSNFLIKEGATIKDSESERQAVHRLHDILNSVSGDVTSCDNNQCLYKKSYDMMQTFFTSYQSNDPNSVSAYDMEQLEMAYKGIQSIRRIISVQIAEECKEEFTMKSIAKNMKNRLYGINMDFLNDILQKATSEETRLRLIKQLSDINTSIDNMSSLLFKNGETDEKEAIETINNKIIEYDDLIKKSDEVIRSIESMMETNKTQRMLMASIRNIDIGYVRSKSSKLIKLNDELMRYQTEHSQLKSEYFQITSELQMVTNELKTIEDAYNQYGNNVAEIDKRLEENKKFKVISEATSSTKGKPVIAIREMVYAALSMTNRLLDVMYGGNMEMLKPEIDESSFTLPFRSGTNKLADIRYGSQSENTLSSLALNMSLASNLTPYNIFIIDELDAFLDFEVSDGFVLMMNDIMTTLQMEQLFIISHKLQPGQYDHCVHTFDLLSEIR